MYVGHALLAFTLGGLAARGLGTRRPQALIVGAVAGGFAVVPDVDTAYTVFVVLEAGTIRVFPTPEYVWTTQSWLVHRALTHSLLVGTATSCLVGIAVTGLSSLGRNWSRGLLSLVAGAAGVGLLGLGFATNGWPGAATMALYLGGALGLAALAVRRDLSPRLTAGAAAIGLLSHPFGDVFMGRPPVFLYPLRTAPPVEALAIAADPTVNLVGLFLLELALAWSALVVFARLDGRPLLRHVEPRALLALGFAATALVIRPPTLDVAYHFAIGVLSTGLVLGFGPGLMRGTEADRSTTFAGFVTALAAVTLAVLAYLVAYLSLPP